MVEPKKLELLAPVGDYNSLAAAVQAGCDAVYFGITQLNMRARSAASMTIDDLKKIAAICHEKNIHAYLTVNTLVYDHDMRIMHSIVDAAKTAGIDAVIAADFSVMQYCKEVGMPVHVSTQASISNYESVKFFSQFTNRVVLARELTLEQIKSIYTAIQKDQLKGSEGRVMEIEAFAHGALCVAQSGRCYMSLYTHNASANRGACKQNCRAKYKVTDVETGKELVIENGYVMSAADICTIDFLDQLLDAGVSVLKIEGRGRPPEYVDTVIRTYRRALTDLENGTYTPERIAEYFTQLESVFNRTLSHGNYFMGKEIGAYSNVYGSKATKEKEYIGFVSHYFTKAGIVEVTVESGEITAGDEYGIIGETTGVARGTVSEVRVNGESAVKAVKGDTLTFPIGTYVRKNDKVYRLIKRQAFQIYGH